MYFVDSNILGLTSPTQKQVWKLMLGIVKFCVTKYKLTGHKTSVADYWSRNNSLPIFNSTYKLYRKQLYRVILYRNHVFWKPCNWDVDSLVTSKRDLALQKYYHSTILKLFMLSFRHIVVIFYSGGCKQMSEP